MVWCMLERKWLLSVQWPMDASRVRSDGGRLLLGMSDYGEFDRCEVNIMTASPHEINARLLVVSG
jgi:hypothetical protein